MWQLTISSRTKTDCWSKKMKDRELWIPGGKNSRYLPKVFIIYTSSRVLSDFRKFVKQWRQHVFQQQWKQHVLLLPFRVVAAVDIQPAGRCSAVVSILGDSVSHSYHNPRKHLHPHRYRPRKDSLSQLRRPPLHPLTGRGGPLRRAVCHDTKGQTISMDKNALCMNNLFMIGITYLHYFLPTFQAKRITSKLIAHSCPQHKHIVG